MTCTRTLMRSRMTATSLLPAATESSPQLPLLPSRRGSISVGTVYSHEELFISALWTLSFDFYADLFSSADDQIINHMSFDFFSYVFFRQLLLCTHVSSCWSWFIQPLHHCWAMVTTHRWLQTSCKFWCPLSASASPFQTTAVTGPNGHPGSPSAPSEPPNSCPLNPPRWQVMR